MKIISKAEARDQGEKRYFTGKPCKHGHIAFRYVSTGACIDCSIQLAAKWNSKNKEKMRCMYRDYYYRHKDEKRDYAKERRLRCREKDKSTRRAYQKRRRKEDSDFAMLCVMRAMLQRLVDRRFSEKSGNTAETLGYAPDELRRHLERQFSKGMSWENYGEWHIDHITSISEHIQNNVTEPSTIHCLTNLRPMWAIDNLKKGESKTNLL